MRISPLLAVITLSLLSPAAAYGQGEPADTRSSARNSIFIDAHTHTTPFSREYERGSVHYEHWIRPGLGIGIGASRNEPLRCPFIPEGATKEDCRPTLLRFPLQAIWLSGEGDHHLELGGGILLGHSSGRFADIGAEGGFLWTVPTRLGYRYQPPSGGLSVRAAYAPTFFGPDDSLIHFAVGVGYAF